ncbi:CGNR zinc finger domain-containing protein [Umezawaea beigongshangensis]|uniref:CGNR zinc finger domain-containing protein n=1 Tax=Umezawaea beigongshangensis TaxID=2780383 RepID=UPI0018F17D07|nr:CGNR zinc finger domain-containing protein [Umezawaea beigongshangensis]
MHFNHYGGTAAELAAALVNAGPAVGPADVLTVLRAHGCAPLGEMSEEDAAELARWAVRLRPVFGEPSRDEQVRVVNGLLADSATQPHVSQHDGRPPHLHYALEDAHVVDRVRAFTAAGLAHLLCQDGDRIGLCGREGCGVVYVDTSRNGRRRFCTPRCANRVHVAEHRSRHTP